MNNLYINKYIDNYLLILDNYLLIYYFHIASKIKNGHVIYCVR